MNRKKNETKVSIGMFSMIGTMVLLTAVALKTDVFGLVFRELLLVVSGNYREVMGNHKTFLMMFPVIFAVVVMEVSCCISALVLQEKVLGKSGGHEIVDLFNSMGDGRHFLVFFIMVLAEELFTRWFFLGFLTRFNWLSGPFAFYSLAIIGNSIWALIHLQNFKKKRDRRLLRVLPQFVSGLFFTYVFVKYGLLAVILTHFASNAILFATHKIQRTNKIDVLIILYWAICGTVSYWSMTKPISDILPWFTDQPTFKLQGWMFWDYVKISIFISSCFGFIFGILLYDRGEAGKKRKLPNIQDFLIGAVVVIGLIYGTYSLLGLITTSVTYRVLILAILMTFLHRGSSGSSMARDFWSNLPDTYVMICIIQALGLWASIGWLLVRVTIQIPRRILNIYDD